MGRYRLYPLEGIRLYHSISSFTQYRATPFHTYLGLHSPITL